MWRWRSGRRRRAHSVSAIILVAWIASVSAKDDDQLRTWLVSLLGGVFGLFFVCTVFMCTWRAIASHWYEPETPKSLLPKEPLPEKSVSLFSWRPRSRYKHRLVPMDYSAPGELSPETKTGDFVV